ncbi:hypothetical protein FM076_30505 [Streptomyces albus subsp. chlorinus]|nr:hypothetical protein [Streptomyces albus subsp. chlorinus]
MLVVAGVGGGMMDVGVVVAGLGGVSWSGVLAGASGDGDGPAHGGVGVVELVGPVDPQMVLARVRLVAGVSGRLLVLLVGELRKDPRKGGLHIGLGAPGQGSAAVRYSGLPWEWLIGELAIRAAGTTTVLLDMAAEAGAWEAVRAGGLPDAPGVGVFGRVVRQDRGPKWRRLRGGSAPVEPAYLLECVRLWRAGGRMPFAELHERAAAASGAAEGAVFLASALSAPSGPQPQPYTAHPRNGHAPWQETVPQDGRDHRPAADLPPWAPGNGHPQPAPPQPQPANGSAPAPTDAPAPSAATASVPAPASASAPAPEPSPRPAPDPQPAPVPSGGAPNRPEGGADDQGGRATEDPHEAIIAAARAGRHDEAEAIAAAWESAAERTEGPGSDGVLHWVEVRADLARLAGDPARSCELWMWVARGRLERGEAEDGPEVEGAVDRAHHQWARLTDEETARELAPELVVLRRRVPGRQPGAVRLVEERAERLLGGVEQ